MNNIFINSKNSGTADPQRLLLNLTNQMNEKRSDKYINMSLYQILTYTAHGKIQKKSYANYKFKISVPTWNEKFKLRGRPYSIPDNQDYFENTF